MPFSIGPESTRNVSGAGSRVYHSSTSSSSTPSPAASWRTTLPHAIESTPGWSSIGTSSIGCPKPMIPKSTVAWS